MNGWEREYICDGFGNSATSSKTRETRDYTPSKEEKKKHKKNLIIIISFYAPIVVAIIIGLCFM